MVELLDPHRLDQRRTYQDEFIGMTNIEVSYEVLEEIRENLIATIHQMLTEEDKKFLISIKRGEPDWNKIGMPHVEQLPGIKWKLMNIKRMDKGKQREALKKLEKVLN